MTHAGYAVPSRKAGLRRRSLPAPARTACCFRSLRFFSSDSDLVHGAGEGGSLQRPDCRPAAASSSATACAAASQSLPVSWPRSQRVTTSLASRSEEHTSELQSLMRTSYAVFCLKKKKGDAKARKHHENTYDNNNHMSN